MKMRSDKKKNRRRGFDKTEALKRYEIFNVLKPEDQTFLLKQAASGRLSQQNLFTLTDACRDMQIWQKPLLSSYFENFTDQNESEDFYCGDGMSDPLSRKDLMKKLLSPYSRFKKSLRDYSGFHPSKPLKRGELTTKESSRKIYGLCPVASEKTRCCHLRTIDAVTGCSFGCSYCTIGTFYEGGISCDASFRKKLSEIRIDPDHKYHFGTGQSSDALVWGNRYGMLDDLFWFAGRHKNIFLELKTKSASVKPVIKASPPENVVLSWTLSPQVIIDHEEHLTASLKERLSAAKEAVCGGIGVAFHFHPVIRFKGWKDAYRKIALMVLEDFPPESVMFISFGTLTFIKPLLKKIRLSGYPTLTTCMEFAADPHGRLTVPPDVKYEIFKTLRGFFPKESPWYFYLCMEDHKFWEESLGYSYHSNEDFEKDFADHVLNKLNFFHQGKSL